MSTARVAVIMGSDSDLPVMRAAGEALDALEVPYETDIVSAHRTPRRMFDFARDAAGRGIGVIVAGAGGAAHLPGMVAALTPLPVVGVPVSATGLLGQDALMSIVQMPRGVPVATVAIDSAFNGGLLAARILGASDPGLRARLVAYAEAQEATVLAKVAKLRGGA